MQGISLAVETGKLAFVPSLWPASGPMSEYCLHLQVPQGSYGLWANVGRIMLPNGAWRHMVHTIILTEFGSEVEGQLVGQITCESRWLLVGDITFLHERDPRGQDKTDRDYTRAMAAVRRGRVVGSTYPLANGYEAMAVRLGVREARLPVAVRTRRGRLDRLEIQVPEVEEVDGE